MKHRKGEMNGVGIFVLMFVVIIVGIALFTVIAQEVGDSTTTEAITNYNVTVTGAGTNYTITDYKYIGGTVTIMNATNLGLLNSGNYTISNNQIVDGSLVSILRVDDDVTFTSGIWSINATSCQRPDYIDSSASRSIAGLIVIFFALAVGVVALSPTMRSGVLDLMR